MGCAFYKMCCNNIQLLTSKAYNNSTHLINCYINIHNFKKMRMYSLKYKSEFLLI